MQKTTTTSNSYTYNLVLTFESVVEIIGYNHPIETSFVGLSHDTNWNVEITFESERSHMIKPFNANEPSACIRSFTWQ